MHMDLIISEKKQNEAARFHQSSGVRRCRYRCPALWPLPLLFQIKLPFDESHSSTLPHLLSNSFSRSTFGFHSHCTIAYEKDFKITTSHSHDLFDWMKFLCMQLRPCRPASSSCALSLSPRPTLINKLGLLHLINFDSFC